MQRKACRVTAKRGASIPGVRARLPQSRWHLSRVLKKWMGVCPGGKEPREGISGEGLTRRQTAGGELQALEEIDTFNTQWALHHQAPFSSISLRCTPFLTLYYLRHTIQILHSRILTLNNPAQIPSSPHEVHATAFLSLVSPSCGVTSPAPRFLGSLLGSCWNHHMRDTPQVPTLQNSNPSWRTCPLAKLAYKAAFIINIWGQFFRLRKIGLHVWRCLQRVDDTASF